MRPHSGSTEEDEIIIANFNPDLIGNIVRISELIGKSKSYVSSRCKELGLKHIPNPEAKKERARESNRRWVEKQKLLRANPDYVVVPADRKVSRKPILGGWFIGMGKPRTTYQKLLSQCIISQ